MRLFFAIPLPAGVQEALAGVQQQLKSAVGGGSWPDPQGLHLTLAFLGEQDVARVPALVASALRVAAGHSTFWLRTSHLGWFPSARAARVLWLGLEEEPRLLALAQDLRGGLRAEGVAFDAKPFKAHLTLARFRAPQAVAALEDPSAPWAFEAREVVLFQSVQTPSGSHYVALGKAEFGRGG